MDTIDMYTIYDENNTLEPSRKTSKKVDLSKPTDTLNHIVKNQGMPMVYHNDNPLSTNVHKRVCLTKPNDKEEKSKRAEMLLNRVILEEEFKTKFENNTKTDTKALKIILSIITLILIVIILLANILNDKMFVGCVLIPMLVVINSFNNKKRR